MQVNVLPAASHICSSGRDSNHFPTYSCVCNDHYAGRNDKHNNEHVQFVQSLVNWIGPFFDTSVTFLKNATFNQFLKN